MATLRYGCLAMVGAAFLCSVVFRDPSVARISLARQDSIGKLSSTFDSDGAKIPSLNQPSAHPKRRRGWGAKDMKGCQVSCDSFHLLTLVWSGAEMELKAFLSDTVEELSSARPGTRLGMRRGKRDVREAMAGEGKSGRSADALKVLSKSAKRQMKEAREEREKAEQSEEERERSAERVRQASRRRAQELRKRETEEARAKEPKLTAKEEAFVRHTLSSPVAPYKLSAQSPSPSSLSSPAPHAKHQTFSSLRIQKGLQPPRGGRPVVAAARPVASKAPSTPLGMDKQVSSLEAMPAAAAAAAHLESRAARVVQNARQQKQRHAAASSTGLSWPKAVSPLLWPEGKEEEPAVAAQFRWPDGQSVKLAQHAAAMRPTKLQVKSPHMPLQAISALVRPLWPGC